MAYTNLNIPRLASAALEGFVKELAALRVFSTSFSPEAVGRTRGNVVLVPLIGALTATTFGGTYAITTFNVSVITVTINRHKMVPIGQTDLDALDNGYSNLEAFGFQQGAALAQCVVEDVLTLVTTANFTKVTSCASTGLDVKQLRAARLALNVDNVPKTGRVALIDATAMDSLLGVTNFVQAQMFKDTGVLQEGRIMRALGMDFYELNSSFVSAASVNAFIAFPSAIAIGMRYLEPQRKDRYDRAEAFTDPSSGATFGLRDFYDPATGTRYMAMECNYGYVVGITNSGRIIGRSD